MNFVLQTTDRFLASLSRDELGGISNALNEVCNGVHIEDAEFQTRLGVTRSFLQQVLSTIGRHLVATSEPADESTSAWADGASVQVRAISVFGDPVDMSTDEARAFAALINDAISEADK
jgi:hypothetical protein